MANRTHLPLAARLQDEAAEWVARHDSGPLCAEAQADFDSWIASSAAHRAAFERYDRLWSDLGAIAGDLGADRAPVKFAELPSNDNRRRRWYAAAGGVAVLALLLVVSPVRERIQLAWEQSPGKVAATPAPAGTLVATAIGEQRIVTMDDGSRIALNTDTRLSSDFAAADRRTIRLERGEAFFEVAHDPSRPFVVQTPYGSVRAVGTKFLVRIEPDHTLSVIVSEGKVLVAKGAMALLLGDKAMAAATPLVAGQEIDLGPAAPLAVATLAPDAVATQLAWRQGDIVFNGESLQTAAAELQRYTRLRISVDPRVARYSVGGYFRTNDIDAFAQSVESVFPVQAVRSRDELRFEPKD